VREWLGAMAVGRIVEHDLENGTYLLPQEARRLPDQAWHKRVVLNLPDDSLVVDSFRLLTGFVLVYAGLSSRCRVQCCALAWPGVASFFL
jgi:hypothetical protein